jgi:hypothetical protein
MSYRITSGGRTVYELGGGGWFTLLDQLICALNKPALEPNTAVGSTSGLFIA